jgi:carbon-monoxide dehydrogenase medium subunit
VAHYQIRNRGTVGGSIAHADPCSRDAVHRRDVPGRNCRRSAKAGTRVIAAAEFFLGPLMTALKPDEIITEIRLPAWPAPRRFGFAEFARRQGDFALAGTAALFYDQRQWRKSAQRPCRRHRRRRPAAAPCYRGETLVNGNEINAARQLQPVLPPPRAPPSIRRTTFTAAAAYRRALISTMIERALNK